MCELCESAIQKAVEANPVTFPNMTTETIFGKRFITIIGQTVNVSHQYDDRVISCNLTHERIEWLENVFMLRAKESDFLRKQLSKNQGDK